MGVKEANEITVKVIVTNEELKKFLEDSGFSEIERFSLDDSYFIPKNLEISSLSEREILAKAVIVRNIIQENCVKKKITFKIKDINSKGEITSQKAINCTIYDIEEAKELLNVIGYYEIMNIKEDDIVYAKDGFEIAVKFLKDNTLMEIETDEKYDSIEKIKDKVLELGLPIDTSNFFVKKAEEQLKKIK